MKLLTHPAFTALGLAQLYLLVLTGQLAASDHLVIYHWSGSAPGLFLPVLLDFFLLWLVLWLLLSLARTTRRSSVAIRSGLALPLPWVLFRSWCVLTSGPMSPRLSVLLLGATVAVFVLIVAGWKPEFASVFKRARGLIATALGFVAIIALFALGQLLWLGWRARTLNATLPLHRRETAAAPAKTRIIWILFDELSYQQVYEERYPGLELPAFDRLASGATVFTHTVPAGRFTERVVPSLFTGLPVDGIRASSDGHQLSIYNPELRAWVRFDPQDTVFEDALNAGYSTAIAGWYNPYCRVMPQVLDQCFWTFNTAGFGGMSPSRTVAENAVAFVRRKFVVVLSLLDQLRNVPLYERPESQFHELDYTRIYSAGDKLLGDRSADLVFLHMPVPHPGGIYDRATRSFATTHSSYIDNLALADRYLGHVRAVLEQNGAWDSSTVIVMGDHSWRTNWMWKPQPSWTREEQIASHGGQFDDRPAYIVKLPYQQQSARIGLPYEAIHTRALLDALIHNRIRSPGDLSAWASNWRERNLPQAIAVR